MKFGFIAGFLFCTRHFTSYQGCRFSLHSARSFIQTGLCKGEIAGKKGILGYCGKVGDSTNLFFKNVQLHIRWRKIAIEIEATFAHGHNFRVAGQLFDHGEGVLVLLVPGLCVVGVDPGGGI